MEILEFKGEDGGFIAKSRHNPYRKALFKCFALLHSSRKCQIWHLWLLLRWILLCQYLAKDSWLTFSAHALRACILGNSEAIHRAEKVFKSRCGQAAVFLVDNPKSINRFAHQQLQSIWETISPTTTEGEQTNRDDDLYFGDIMDIACPRKQASCPEELSLVDTRSIKGGFRSLCPCLSLVVVRKWGSVLAHMLHLMLVTQKHL
jgi:hypothetical protein